MSGTRWYWRRHWGEAALLLSVAMAQALAQALLFHTALPVWLPGARSLVEERLRQFEGAPQSGGLDPYALGMNLVIWFVAFVITSLVWWRSLESGEGDRALLGRACLGGVGIGLAATATRMVVPLAHGLMLAGLFLFGTVAALLGQLLANPVMAVVYGVIGLAGVLMYLLMLMLFGLMMLVILWLPTALFAAALGAAIGLLVWMIVLLGGYSVAKAPLGSATSARVPPDGSNVAADDRI